MKLPPCYLFIWCFLLLHISFTNSLDLTAKIVGKFYNPELRDTNHLAIEEITGRVYLGAVNHLYKLSPNLELEEHVQSGPKNDSTKCPPPKDGQCPKNVQKTLTDNVNKALIVDNDSKKLIVCGSLFQGACDVRELQNISKVIQESLYSVVANDENSSTVAFIASGPSGSKVMYTAVTYTGNSEYRWDVPAVSSRSLDTHKMFDYANTEASPGTRIFVNSLFLELYRIDYVHGFSHDGFSYFFTIQRTDTSSRTMVSKLIRICQDDEYYNSYTEVVIRCTSDYKDYNLIQAAYVGKPGSALARDLGIDVKEDVLFTVFAESDSPTKNKPSDKTAVCVYSMKEIKDKFTQNIQLCHWGNGERGLNFITPSMACTRTILKIEDDFCGNDVNPLISGIMPITASTAITFDNTSLTAVVSISSGYDTILFLGTDKGYLKKILVNTAISATVYQDIPIDPGVAIKKDLCLDQEKEYLYVLTSKGVLKVKTHSCSDAKTHIECANLRDSSCGWCLDNDKCVASSGCPGATEDSSRWTSMTRPGEAKITSVKPNRVQKTTAEYLDVTVENMIQTPGRYYCHFSPENSSDAVLVSNARLTNKGVRCATPRADLLPRIAEGRHNMTMKMSVGIELASTNFTFFDCDSYTSCTECVTSEYRCDWCIEGDRCTHSTEYCRNDIIISNVAKVYNRRGEAFCPAIFPEKSRDVLIPFGEPRIVKFRVRIHNIFVAQSSFLCYFTVEDQVIRVNAQLIADIIYCSTVTLPYEGHESSLIVPVSVLWNDKFLDNPENVRVILYRCENMASDYEECASLEKKYNCIWCTKLRRCSRKVQCDLEDEAVGRTTNINVTEVFT